MAIIIRWIARILSALFVVFILFFLLADLFGKEETGGGVLSAKDGITFFFFPISTIVGLVIAWNWERMGGLITVLGLIGLVTIRPDLLSSFFLIGIVAIPGLLFILYWYLAREPSDLPGMNKP